MAKASRSAVGREAVIGRTTRVRGRVSAFDVNTGKHMWTAYSTGPDSETLIDATLALLREEERGKPLRVLDIGTGTGCLLLTLLLELPEATGIGTDATKAAWYAADVFLILDWA